MKVMEGTREDFFYSSLKCLIDKDLNMRLFVAKSLCKGGEQRILKDSSLLIVWSSRFRK